MTSGWRRWLRIWRRSAAADVDAELRFHLDERTEELVAAGLTWSAARSQAEAEFGDLEAARAQLGEIDRRIAERQRRAEWWETIAQDLRHTLRGLARSPGFTVMVVVTLALGIGANAAVFSLLNRLFLAPPAGVTHPEDVRRVSLTEHSPNRPAPYTRSAFNYPEFRSVAAALPSSVHVAGAVPREERIGRSADAPRREVNFTVGDYFGVLGLRPAIGRFFSGAETGIAGRTAVAVISHQMWRAQFAGTQAVLGQPLDLGPHRYTIVGVAPKGFAGDGLDAVDVWVPFNTLDSWASPTPDYYDQTGTMMIRMLAHTPSPAAVSALQTDATRAFRTSRRVGDSLATASVTPLRGAAGPEFYERQLAIAERLAGVAAIILLIACANVANLMLARAASRRRETAVRLALGVSRRRLVGQLLSESVVVAGVAGLAAVLTVVWGAAALRELILPNVQWGGGALNLRVGLFAAIVSLGAGIAAGIVPAIQGSRPDITNFLKSDARSGRRVRSRTRTTLVVVQAALSLVLLAGAGLFIQSLRDVESIHLGYDAPRLLFASAGAEDDPSRAREITARLPALADRIGLVPGVERVALTGVAPMRGFSTMDVFLPGRDSVPRVGRFGGPLVAFGSAGFFSTLGIRVLAGRGFTEADRAGAAQVVVVNRTLAQAYWPGESAVGKCLIINKRTDPCRRVVGVVVDAHMLGVVEDPIGVYYVPLAQAPHGWTDPGTIVVRAAPGERAAVRVSVLHDLRNALGPQAVVTVRSMDDIVGPE
ncbi:MAG TPA: ABC transporter permease, partial [Vicinamibacterales bacterium]|nr:ABC transporter permease [Vicinamibacterales bacterium]